MVKILYYDGRGNEGVALCVALSRSNVEYKPSIQTLIQASFSCCSKSSITSSISSQPSGGFFPFSFLRKAPDVASKRGVEGGERKGAKEYD
jgi:hypothetical protein